MAILRTVEKKLDSNVYATLQHCSTQSASPNRVVNIKMHKVIILKCLNVLKKVMSFETMEKHNLLRYFEMVLHKYEVQMLNVCI